MCADHAQFVVRVEAGVKREKLIEHRGEDKHFPLAEKALRLDAQVDAQAAQWQTVMQAIDRFVANRTQCIEAAPADFLRLAVVITRQVVGFEDHFERVDIGQRQVVERHVADQFPQEILVQGRCKTGGRHTDIAEGDKVRCLLAGLVDVTDLQVPWQIVVGTGQLDRQCFLRMAVPMADRQPVAAL